VPVTGRILDGIGHVVLGPRWGRWSESLLDQARQRGIPTSLVGEAPPAGVPGPWRTVIASDRQLSPGSWRDIDVDLLAITHGANGSSIRVRGEWLEVPAMATEVVDPTGAGDVFAGTFLGQLEQGASVRTAATTAAAAAADCCKVWGTQTALRRGRVARSRADRMSRARGALWGLACGDAFGMPTSFLPRATLERLWPKGLSSLSPAPHQSPYHAGYPGGKVTDDTEQALAVTRALGRSSATLDPQIVAEELDAWLSSVGGETSLAVGPSTLRGLRAWRQGTPVTESGRGGTSNGAAMRIAPVGVLHGLNDDDDLADVLAACMPTHHTSPAVAGAAAVAAAIAVGVRGHDWTAVIEAGVLAARNAGDSAPWIYAPDISGRIELAISVARGSTSDAECADRLSRLIGAGEPTSEAVPTAFGFAARAEGDPRRAIIEAANTEGDTDTIAAMAGAISGSWAGEDAIPAEWRTQVAEVNELDINQWAIDLERVAERRRSQVHA
jgi:ADP-ribosylglycohydrolase